MRPIALVGVCVWIGLAVMPSARQPELRTATTAILFDVVVRDGKGVPVGGLLLDNTNDVERIARRIAEDQASHYLLAYTPGHSEMDGTYRRVAVKVTRTGATATHRSGYWAVPTTP